MAVTVLLLALELLCVALVVTGVALWSVPAGLTVAGLLGILVLERAQATRHRKGVQP
ncbi:hypothetical protein ABZ498_06570 [Streptomyces lavendulocolor]|uniref:hypothetical protein n=1 Tax=Streptomyces lavendulocolor TaxID=67316 RepID=UPI0033D24304